MCRQYNFTDRFEECDKWSNSEMTVYILFTYRTNTYVDLKGCRFLQNKLLSLNNLYDFKE